MPYERGFFKGSALENAPYIQHSPIRKPNLESFLSAKGNDVRT
jgi:hypothetical protein